MIKVKMKGNYIVITKGNIKRLYFIGNKVNEIHRKVSSWFFHKKCLIEIFLNAIVGKSQAICLYNGKEDFFDVVQDEEKYWSNKGFICYSSVLPLYATGSLVIDIEKTLG